MFLQLIGFTVKHECHGAILRWLWFAKTGFLYGDCTYLHMTVAAAAASATAAAAAAAAATAAAASAASISADRRLDAFC